MAVRAWKAGLLCGCLLACNSTTPRRFLGGGPGGETPSAETSGGRDAAQAGEPSVPSSGGGGLGDESPGGDGGGGTANQSPSAGAGNESGAGADGDSCPCDCDRDGALSEACLVEGEPVDCDDGDPDVRPGQQAWFTEPNPVVGFDYDCSDALEPAFAEPLQTCPALTLGECPAAQGYLDELPACGSPGQWAECAKDGLECAPVLITQSRSLACH
jgi:hypothetical protein